MACCYILFSPTKNTYYIGFTQMELSERIIKHNSGFYDKTYSSFTSDWQLFLIIECVSVNQAIQIEKHIKRMKSKVYVENLKKYPEMVEKLLNMYRGS